MSERLPSRKPLTRQPALASRAPAPDDGADPSRVKQEIVNKDEPRMNTNRHEYGGTSFRQVPPPPPKTVRIIQVGNKWCFNKESAKSHGFKRFHGIQLPGHQICFRQGRSPQSSRRESHRLLFFRDFLHRCTGCTGFFQETAGLQSRASASPQRIIARAGFRCNIIPFIGVHSCPLVVRRFPSWLSFIPSLPCDPVTDNLSALVALRCSSCAFVDHSFLLFQASRAPAPDDGADQSGVKQG